LPLVAAEGTVAVTWVVLLTAAVAVVPLNLTVVDPMKLVPVITTEAPGAPRVGLKLEIVGAGTMTLKLAAEAALPFGVVTEILPVVAVPGTVAEICVSLFTMNPGSPAPLNWTTVAPVKLVPVTVTAVPAAPLVGLKLVIVGWLDIVKLVLEPALPTGVHIRTLPLVVPAATTAVIWVALSTEKLAAGFPLKLTFVVPVRFVPVMTTLVPALPEVGVKLEIVGFFAGGVWLEAAAPQPAIAISRGEQTMLAPTRAFRPVCGELCNPSIRKPK